MWIRMGLNSLTQACAGSDDFFTVGKGLYDKKVLENRFRYTTKIHIPLTLVSNINGARVFKFSCPVRVDFG